MSRSPVSPVTVVCIRSLSYTGTTWLNTVIGCHERAFALGPADRGLRLAMGEETGAACLVHGVQCQLWPGFLEAYDRTGNFFLQLAKHAGKDIIVTNNLIPDKAGKHLDHPSIVTRHIQVVRDGRALAASFKRKFPAKTFIEAITGFLQPSFHHFNWDTGNPDLLCIRYEDTLAAQEDTLARIASYLDIDYTPDALRFWEWRHHHIAGNQGTIALCRLAEGLPIGNFEGRTFYEEHFRRISGGDPYSFKDDRADERLTRFDRFVFDCLAGADNERYGYERDRFTTDEVRDFSQLLQLARQRGRVTGDFTRELAFFFGGEPSQP